MFVCFRFTVALLAVAIASPALATTTPPMAPEQPPIETIEAIDCWHEEHLSPWFECGLLKVPEQRERPTDYGIELPFIIAKTSDEPEKPPLIFLGWSAGQALGLDSPSMLGGLQRFLDEFAGQRDLIFIDLRGVGVSNPNLDCPELDDPRIFWGLRDNPPKERDPNILRTESVLAWKAAVFECRDRLRDQGHDLSAYNNQERAADVAALIRFLRAETASLFGSYEGARVALTVMRDYPELLESVVLDSVLPPQASPLRDDPRNVDKAFGRLFDACGADRECNSAYPSLRRSFEKTLVDLARKPIDLELDRSNGRPPLILTVDSAAYLALTSWLLSDGTVLPRLPLLIDRVSKGEFWRLKYHAQRLYLDGSNLDYDLAAWFSGNCRDEFRFESIDEIKSAAKRYPLMEARVLDSLAFGVCDYWPSGRAPPLENAPVSSAVPTLLLAGAYDPYSPPELALGTAETLSNSHVFVFRNSGSAPSATESCATEVVSAFLQDPSKRPDPPCFKGMRPRGFLVLTAD